MIKHISEEEANRILARDIPGWEVSKEDLYEGWDQGFVVPLSIRRKKDGVQSKIYINTIQMNVII